MKITITDNDSKAVKDLASAVAQEILSLRFQVARNELLFMRSLREIAIGTPVVDEESFWKAVSCARQELKYEDVKKRVDEELDLKQNRE